MSRKKRVKKFACASGVIGLALALYYFFVRASGMAIPCVFYTITGLRCPGCGVTHMLLAAARLDFEEAFRWNQALFVLSPFLLLDAFWCVYLYVQYGKIKSMVHDTFVWIVLVLLVVFAILRNLLMF